MNESAAAGEEALARWAGGAMLYDASALGQSEPRLFDLGHWRQAGSIETTSGGRGTVAFVRTPQGERWVLRHYRRGGLISSLTDDLYLWTGEARTRSFREWRLLRQLREWQLPVPRPIAAGYRRHGPCYRADLLTEELPVRQTLAQALRAGALPVTVWEAVGRCIGDLHTRGVQHADLNANNLLLGENATVYVLDFDRGRIRARGAWEQAVLLRLQRSLRKVTAGLPPDRFGADQWQALLAGSGD
jgi:3-deoxy-D-manno-octulosonic acid kinase